MQHTVSCTRGRSWVTPQLQNCYSSQNSQPISEPHTQSYSTTRETTHEIPYTVPRNRQAERGGGQVTYWRKGPVAQQPRRIPFHIRQKVEAELHAWTRKKGIIEHVYIWLYSLGFATGDNTKEECICVDMRAVNQAITRERHPLPTLDDLIHTLNRATVFSTQAWSKSRISSSATVLRKLIHSHFRDSQRSVEIHMYTQLNFGTKSASEIFQKTKQDQLQGIPGTLNISDDVIIYGETQAAELLVLFARSLPMPISH